MATIDGTDLRFLRDDREVTGDNLRAIRALVGVFLIGIVYINLAPAIESGFAYVTTIELVWIVVASAVTGVPILAAIYWGLLRAASEQSEAS